MVRIKMFGRGLSLQIAIMVACEMAFILFGYDQGVFSGIIGNSEFLQVVKNPDSAMLGIIVSIYNLGCFTGCIINFIIGEYIGRRKAMWIAMFFVILGAALQTSAMSTGHLMAGRFITGIGTGIETSTVPMYQSELVEPHKRGRVVCSEPLFVGVGIVISYFFDYGMSKAGGQIAWRLPIACQIIFALVVVVLVFGLPESPRWLARKGRSQEALEILSEVYGVPTDHEKVVTEHYEIQQAIETEQKNGEYSWRNIFKRDEVQTGKRVALAYGMQVMNQLGGINLVVYYVTTVLQDNVGLSRNLSLILGGCINTMFVIGSFYPTFFSDRSGRRAPMIWGSAILGFCMMMIAILLSFKGSAVSKPTAAAAVAFFFVYMLVFGGTVNCIPWVYVPEILPLHARAKGTAVGISANWIWNFFVVMITPVILTDLAWKAYLIFMCTNFAFVPLVYFCYPETANLSLEEMDLIFSNKDRGAVALSKEIFKDRKYGARRASLFSDATRVSISENDKKEVDGIEA